MINVKLIAVHYHFRIENRKLKRSRSSFKINFERDYSYEYRKNNYKYINSLNKYDKEFLLKLKKSLLIYK